jgi:hypothetical protein
VIGGDPIPQRDLGAILDAAFKIYGANANKLFVIVAVVVVPLSLISHLLTGVVFAARSTGFLIATTLITALITLITYAILQAALIRGAAQATVGDAVDVETSYKWGLRKFGWVLLVSIATGIMVVIGFILLIVPGVILLTRFTVAIPALVIEDRKGIEAIDRSWNLTKGHFWHVLGTVVVAALITGVVSGDYRGAVLRARVDHPVSGPASPHRGAHGDRAAHGLAGGAFLELRRGDARHDDAAVCYWPPLLSPEIAPASAPPCGCACSCPCASWAWACG